MSGASLAVGPGPQPGPSHANPNPKSEQQQPTPLGGVMGSLRVIELQLVAFIMVFSASGLVPMLDLMFPAFASSYILVLSRFAFPNVSARTKEAEIFQGSRLFRLYVVAGTTVGLFLPLAYVLGGFARGDCWGRGGAHGVRWDPQRESRTGGTRGNPGVSGAHIGSRELVGPAQ